jgi:hypothetical protein
MSLATQLLVFGSSGGFILEPLHLCLHLLRRLSHVGLGHGNFVIIIFVVDHFPIEAIQGGAREDYAGGRRGGMGTSHGSRGRGDATRAECVGGREDQRAYGGGGAHDGELG